MTGTVIVVKSVDVDRKSKAQRKLRRKLREGEKRGVNDICEKITITLFATS